MTNPFDLSGKVAIVTGANTGIGQAIALALAEAGADIAAVGRTPAQETVDKARALGRRAEIVSADLSTIEPVQRIVDETVDKLGGLDILVNNAGIIRRADAVDFTEEDWDAVVDTNLKSVFFLCQAAGRYMIGKGGGKIINIASMLSFQGGIRVASYTASKSGLLGLTRLLANEWAVQGINVNAIAPGVVDGEHWDVVDAHFAKWEGLKPGEKKAQVAKAVPIGRFANPQDIAGLAVFLASSDSDYILAQTYNVDGGNWMS